MSNYPNLHDCLAELARSGRVALEDWPVTPASLSRFGLRADGDSITWEARPDLLDSRRLAIGLDGYTIETFHAIDSTNTYLMALAGEQDVHQRLCLAECQLSGRGRRGNTWISPYARNLAMSIGWRISRPFNELGGLSIAVGMGLLAGLETLGVQDASVKWPNDIHVRDAKLSGILVELAQAGASVQAVIGIGVNVALEAEEAEAIDQAITDLRRCGVAANRTEIAVALLQEVCSALEVFSSDGFGPFIEPFNRVHKLHGQDCHVLMGERRIPGRVVGVGADGELIMQTAGGEQRFHGGEVSLRS